MMVRLGELLVSRGLISQDHLLQALQAQAQFGGRLGTNLVEMGFISELQLAKALSDQLHVPYVDSEEVANVPSQVIGMVSRELAKKYRAVPFRLENRVLCVCMSDPMNLQVVDELGFALNTAVKPFVITEVALNYAMERYYGLPRESRFLKLSGTTPAAATFIHLADAPATSSDSAVTVNRAQFFNAEPRGDIVAPGLPMAAKTPDMAEELANVREHREVLSCLVRFTASVFERSIVVGVQGGHLVGLTCSGLGLDAFQVQHLRLPIAEGGLLHDAIASVRVVQRDQTDDAQITALCQTVGLEARLLTVLPILESRRTVMLALCWGLSGEQVRTMFPEVRRMLSQVSAALQILTLRKEILSARL